MTASSFEPDYIPPHLEGRVSDFRREPDGRVSFFDPRAAFGTFGPEASRTTIEPDVFRSTFGPGRLNLVEAANNQYGLPQTPSNLVAKAHDWIVDKTRKGIHYGTSSQGKAVGTVGLLGALAGGLSGSLGEEGSLKKGLLYALLAGGASAGVTALGQNFHNNREARLQKSAFASSDLLSLVAANAYIPEMDKRQYLALFQRLQQREKDELAQLLRVTSGFAAGALIARYLRGKGLLTTIVGGMIGALAGRALSPQPIYNNLGQLSVLNLQR